MKQSVTFSDFTNAFRAHGREDQFTYDALHLLFDYFENYEEDAGDELELDVIAICCEYSEESVNDILANYDIADRVAIDQDADADDIADARADTVREFLNDRTSIVGEVNDSFVYLQF